MSTAAQQKANKQNAQHSTGPRTAEGEQRSSLKPALCFGGSRSARTLGGAQAITSPFAPAGSRN